MGSAVCVTIKEINLYNRHFSYELVRKKVKNINLRIKSDLSISVSANKRISDEEVEKFLRTKADWIIKAVSYYEQKDRADIQELALVDGERVRLLGKELTIRLLGTNENKIELKNEIIYIMVKDINNAKKIKALWEKWYTDYTWNVIEQVVDRIVPIFKKYGIPRPQVKLRTMKTRWGSCSIHNGCITLNKLLIQVPIECVEYVVVHEFTHFIHPNHSKKFYDFLSVIMPDYKERTKLLKK